MKLQNCLLGDKIILNYGKSLPEETRLKGEYNVYGSSGIVDNHCEYLVSGPGVIVGRKGNVGSVFYEKNAFYPIDTVYFITKKDSKDNLKYFYYLLKTLNLSQFNSDAAVPGLNREAALRIRINVHDSKAQNEITSILSSYDDLKQNNLKRIDLLRQSVQLLYYEWFVRLKFPGHENTKITKGVPEGWERIILSELCGKIEYGFTASASIEPLGPKYLRITDIASNLINWENVPYCKIEDTKIEKYRLLEGDIVIARTGATVGYAKRINKMHPLSVFASYLIRISIVESYSNLLIGTIVESDFYKEFVKSQIGGAAQPNANAKVLTSIKILYPNRSIQEAFDALAKPIYDQIELLNFSNIKLAKASDLLLPKLLRGEIEV